MSLPYRYSPPPNLTFFFVPTHFAFCSSSSSSFLRCRFSAFLFQCRSFHPPLPSSVAGPPWLIAPFHSVPRFTGPGLVIAWVWVRSWVHPGLYPFYFSLLATPLCFGLCPASSLPNFAFISTYLCLCLPCPRSLSLLFCFYSI